MKTTYTSSFLLGTYTLGGKNATTELRTRFGDEMKKREIAAHICYVPLHSAPMGRKLSEQWGIKYDCPITEDYGSRVIRLPLHAGMTKDDAVRVAENTIEVLRSF